MDLGKLGRGKKNQAHFYTAALLSAWHCGNGELPEDAASTTAGLSITYDGKEGSGPGWLKCAPPECRLAHVHPGVC